MRQAPDNRTRQLHHNGALESFQHRPIPEVSLVAVDPHDYFAARFSMAGDVFE